jgi:hypothetical protein
MRDKRNRSDEETQIKASNYQKVRSKSVWNFMWFSWHVVQSIASVQCLSRLVKRMSLIIFE